MSEEYLVNDVPWDDDSIVDREPESSGSGSTHFGFLRLHAVRVTKSWQKGHYFTIPGVTGGNYDEKDDSGLMMFKGWDKGGSQWFFALVATKENKDGESYQAVQKLPGKLQKEGEPHKWADFVLPALKQLSKAERDKLSSEGLYCQWSEVGTGHIFEIEGEKKEGKVWVDFKPFASKEAMKQAETVFWAERNNGASGGQTGVFYPASWTKTQDGVSQMLTYGKGLGLTGKALADKLNLFNETKDNGEKLTEEDVKNVIAKMLDCPVPMVDLS